MVTVSGNSNPTNPTYPTNPTNPTMVHRSLTLVMRLIGIM